MKTITYLALYLFLLSGLSAQTDTLSGVINHYTPVTGIDTCSAALTVTNPSGFQSGDTILIVQMQGAALDLEDNNTFGSITDMGTAGAWEQAVIQEVSGNTLLLAQAFLHHYDPTGKVQAVSFPYFENAIVEGTLTAQPWNGETGGILALKAGLLTLNGDLVVSGQGFRGGNAALDYDGSCTWLINYQDYRFDANSIRGGMKGEGIGGVPAAWPRGRGAAANGGGGGNDHNAGGGGGALLMPGGQGGENENPSFLGCKGFGEGAAGWALPNNNRLFLGGGGGAGHGNNNVGTDGGNGGGIILVDAGQIIANAQFFSADGENAENASGDGAGGGGAGGIILVKTNSTVGPLTLSAMGGNGGSANNNNQEQCFGPGGGGSGGYIQIADGFNTDILLYGGEPGLSLNSLACPESPNGATMGSYGIIEGIPFIPVSTTQLPQPPSAATDQDTLTACADLLTLSATLAGDYTELSWEFNNTGSFLPVPENAAYSNTNTSNLTINNPTMAAGLSFRLAVFSDCLPPVYSDLITIAPGIAPVAGFTYAVNGLSVSFENTGTTGASYSWNFGDGNPTASGAMPTHTYVTSGIYTVSLTVSNNCGNTTTQETVIVGSAPVPDFGISGSSTGCAPRSIGFVNQSTGTIDSLQWSFPGGVPLTSSQPNPTITYEIPGTYDVSLTLFSSFGPQQITVEDQVTIYPRPTAAFAYEVDGLTLTFINLSSDATFYSWNFGDGQTSTAADPVHTFPAAGSYDVTLNASNPNCSRATTESIFLQPSGNREAAARRTVRLFPNPAANQTCLQTDLPLSYPLYWQCYNTTGKRVADGKLSNGQDCIDLVRLAGGTYYIKVRYKEGVYVLPVVVE
jgi:PKD repeat protein